MADDIDAIRGYNPPAEGGTFLKLADGETAKVRITSLPVIFQNEFKMGDEVTISTRFAFVIWNHEVAKAQIWQTNGATYAQQIKPLLEDDEYGDWREYDVKISRTGEKAQTRYNLRPGTKRYDLEDKQLDQCGSIDIIAILKKSDSISKVYWLSEWREMEEEAKKGGSTESGYDQAKRTARALKGDDSEKSSHTEGVADAPESKKIDDVHPVTGDEPMNLDDIPF